MRGTDCPGSSSSLALKPTSYLIRYSLDSRFRAGLPDLGHYVSCARHDCSLSKKSQINRDSKSVASLQIENVGRVRPRRGLVPRRLAAGMRSEKKIQEDDENEYAGFLGESCEVRRRDRTRMRSFGGCSFSKRREALSANWSG